MAKPESANRRLFWPTLGLIVFLLLWLAVCTAGFWYIYQYILAGSSDPSVSLTALQWTTWPFTVLVVAGPMLLLLSVGGLRVVRDLLEMQKLIVGLPKTLESMQVVVDEFKTLRAQLITDVSRANDASIETPLAVQEEEEAPQGQAPHVTEFLDLYEEAKGIFYRALEDFNTRGEEPLIVQRGGANFVEIASRLRDKREFAKNGDENQRTADFIIRAFELERASRRYRTYLTTEMVRELRSLRAKLKVRNQ